MKVFITKSEGETKRLGRKIGENLSPGDVIALVGELGSGKTILVKGIGLGLGISEKFINSPSFVLIKEYPARINLYHFDLYRLENLEEIETLGWEDYLSKRGILIIEWADKMKKILPKEYLLIEIDILDERKRKVKLISQGKKYINLINII